MIRRLILLLVCFCVIIYSGFACGPGAEIGRYRKDTKDLLLPVYDKTNFQKIFEHYYDIDIMKFTSKNDRLILENGKVKSGAFLFKEAVTFDVNNPNLRRELIALRDSFPENLSHYRYNKEFFLSASFKIDKLLEQEEAYDYARYLKAVNYFYSKEYNAALDVFQELQSCESKWVSETSCYMIARTLLIIAQCNWSGYYSYRAKRIDSETLDLAFQKYKDYIKKYPDGLYLQSAIDIQKRIFLLGGEKELLFERMREDFGYYLKNQKEMDSDFLRFRSIILEFIKFYKDGAVDFTFPFVIELQYDKCLLNEKFAEEDTTFKSLNQLYKELEECRQNYPGFDEYYDYIELKLLLDFGKYDELMAKYSEMNFKSSLFLNGAKLLLAIAYEQLDSLDETESVIMDLISTSKDKETSIYHQRNLLRFYKENNLLNRIAQPGTKLNNERYISKTLHFHASDSLLSSISLSKDYDSNITKFAQNVFLRRLLLEGKHKKFMEVYKQLNDKSIFSQVETAVRNIIKNPDDPVALLNIGYFMFYHHISPEWNPSGAYYFRRHVPEYREDSVLKPLDNFLTPLDYLKKALVSFSRTDQNINEAKTLHYLIIAFKQSKTYWNWTWAMNSMTENKGKEWFDLLHSKYPDSKWAKKTPYYY